MRLPALWRAMHLNRWHKNPDLRNINDDVMAHSARMGVLALRLWPGDQALACACLTHDLGEMAAGDMCGAFKRDNPELQALLELAEAAAVAAMGFAPAPADPRLDMLDKLDAYLTAQLHAPHIMDRPDWVFAREALERKILACLSLHGPNEGLMQLLDEVS